MEWGGAKGWSLQACPVGWEKDPLSVPSPWTTVTLMPAGVLPCAGCYCSQRPHEEDTGVICILS